VAERREIDEAYRRRRFGRKHDPGGPGDWYLARKRWNIIVEILRRLVAGQAGGRYLDVGCGEGHGLVTVAAAGLGLREIVGIDLWLDPVLRTSAVRHGIRTVCADAGSLPFSDESFEIAMQCMLLTSVMPRLARAQVAREIVRVVRPGGYILSFDLRYPALPPFGRVALGLRGLRRLFPGLTLVSTGTHVVLPPLARMLGGSARACDLLGSLAPLRTYRSVVFRRPA
jgi:SAM-dependent methyltransferase